MLHVPEALLEERRRLGADRQDEMWEGVLHMVPPASGDHQRLSFAIALVFASRAHLVGLVPHMETGLYGGDDDYRVPDQIYARPSQLSPRGVEGDAPLVVEVLSPGDETYAKLDWYGDLGVGAVLVIEPGTRQPELFVNHEGRMVQVQSDQPLPVAVLGVALSVANGPKLRIVWDRGSAEV